ncbi:hypothetical protein KDN24_06695 [Bacillus sp. Bva_UNVM-123]|uniref:hypothetical protein n=1 Tax=Bacillus sp. Bva_UNVM-123 TaxID=2829798 RepID=UPI00391FB91C
MIHLYSLLIGLLTVGLFVGVILVWEKKPEIIAYSILIIFVLAVVYLTGQGVIEMLS